MIAQDDRMEIVYLIDVLPELVEWQVAHNY